MIKTICIYILFFFVYSFLGWCLEVICKLITEKRVINSLRIEEVPFLPYMDRPADTKAGCKHRCTDADLRYFKSEVMELSLIHI